jgi:hypothetical protein
MQTPGLIIAWSCMYIERSKPPLLFIICGKGRSSFSCLPCFYQLFHDQQPAGCLEQQLWMQQLQEQQGCLYFGELVLFCLWSSVFFLSNEVLCVESVRVSGLEDIVRRENNLKNTDTNLWIFCLLRIFVLCSISNNKCTLFFKKVYVFELKQILVDISEKNRRFLIGS